MTLSGTGGTLGVNRTTSDGTANAKTLALNLGGGSVGAVTGTHLVDFTTVNVATSGATTTLADFQATGATAVNISGSNNVTFTAQGFAATAAITSTSTANVSLGTALATGQLYTGGAGADTITVSAAGTKAITTADGDDVVTYSGVLGTGGSIDAGAGSDTAKMTTALAVAATASAAFAATVSNFEVLQLSNTTGGAVTINFTNADGMNSLTTTGVDTGALTITNVAAGFTLTQTAANTAAQSVSMLVDTGTSDVVNLVFKGTNGYTNGANATTIANIETLNITTDDTDTTAATTPFTSIITATAVKTVTIAGDAGLDATGLTGTALTSFDASGVTATGAGGAVTITTGALAAAATLTGGAGTNTINAAAATKAVTITGGAGTDTLTGGAGGDTIVGGNGTNTLVGGAGIDTITGGTGVDTITGGTGADTLTGGTGADVFIYSTVGDSTRTNLDTITDLAVGTGGDSITLVDTGTEVGVAGGVLTAAMTDVSLAGTFLEALDIASAGAGNTNAIVTWFQYAGNTYLVEDRGLGATNDPATDVVIKITGIVDLLAGTNLAITFA